MFPGDQGNLGRVVLWSGLCPGCGHRAHQHHGPAATTRSRLSRRGRRGAVSKGRIPRCRRKVPFDQTLRPHAAEAEAGEYGRDAGLVPLAGPPGEGMWRSLDSAPFLPS